MSGSSSLDYTEHFEAAAREQKGMERLMRDTSVTLMPAAIAVECDHGVRLTQNCGACEWLSLSTMFDGSGVLADLALDLACSE